MTQNNSQIVTNDNETSEAMQDNTTPDTETTDTQTETPTNSLDPDNEQPQEHGEPQDEQETETNPDENSQETSAVQKANREAARYRKRLREVEQDYAKLEAEKTELENSLEEKYWDLLEAFTQQEHYEHNTRPVLEKISIEFLKRQGHTLEDFMTEDGKIDYGQLRLTREKYACDMGLLVDYRGRNPFSSPTRFGTPAHLAFNTDGPLGLFLPGQEPGSFGPGIYYKGNTTQTQHNEPEVSEHFIEAMGKQFN